MTDIEAPKDGWREIWVGQNNSTRYPWGSWSAEKKFPHRHLYVRGGVADEMLEALKKHRWAMRHVEECNFAGVGPCLECREVARDVGTVLDEAIAKAEGR